MFCNTIEVLMCNAWTKLTPPSFSQHLAYLFWEMNFFYGFKKSEVFGKAVLFRSVPF